MASEELLVTEMSAEGVGFEERFSSSAGIIKFVMLSSYSHKKIEHEVIYRSRVENSGWK